MPVWTRLPARPRPPTTATIAPVSRDTRPGHVRHSPRLSTPPLDTASCEGTPAAGPRRLVCRLTVVHPPQLRAVLDLGEATHVLGREVEAGGGFALAHATVSRRHAELRWDARTGCHTARDLGSRNGSALHGAPLGELPRVLDDNAVLRLGDVLAVYERARGPAIDPGLVDRDAVPGEALAILAFRAALARAARDPSPVLLIGESGSGKERSAAEVHRLSGRRGPLVALNCAALSPQLVESQLFGHHRGAFTGATAAQPGLFRAAEGGTLWLDEIGELPLDAQPKLLRAIEAGEILPVGATAPIRVDVRVIAATNRVLADEVAAGRFRRDLYARLALWEVALPPIARRRVDILPWLARLAADWAAARGLPPPEPPTLTPAAAAAILGARWPDNLRGLHRLVHALADRLERPIRREDLPTWLVDAAPAPAPAGPLPAAEPTPAAQGPLKPRPSRDELLAALAAHAWNLTATARAYARDRKQISRWIAMYGIDVPDRG